MKAICLDITKKKSLELSEGELINKNRRSLRDKRSVILIKMNPVENGELYLSFDEAQKLGAWLQNIKEPRI